MIDEDKKLEFTANTSQRLEDMLDHIAEEMDGKKENGCSYRLGQRYGNGTLEGFTIAPGLEIVRWKTNLKEPFAVSRTSEKGQLMWSILLTASNSLQAIDTSSETEDSTCSAYVYNSSMDVNLFGANIGPIQMILIRVHPEFWHEIPAKSMRGNVQLFTEDEPMFKAFHLDDALSLQFRSLLYKKNDLFLNDWQTLISTLTICNEVFSQLAQRKLMTRIKNTDITALYRGTMLMLADLKRPLSIEEVCSQVGLGRDKFRRLFKQVYELTPYQYFQQHRMLKAQKLISQGQCTVTQAGYQIGYSHLGHFSQAYKKQFGILPKQASLT